MAVQRYSVRQSIIRKEREQKKKKTGYYAVILLALAVVAVGYVALSRKKQTVDLQYGERQTGVPI